MTVMRSKRTYHTSNTTCCKGRRTSNNPPNNSNKFWRNFRQNFPSRYYSAEEGVVEVDNNLLEAVEYWGLVGIRNRLVVEDNPVEAEILQYYMTLVVAHIVDWAGDSPDLGVDRVL